MSAFLQKFAPTVADVSDKQYGAAVPGVVGGVAGYALSSKHKTVGVLAGMASGDVAHALYKGSNVTREVVVNALGVLGALLLPKYAPKAIVRALPSGLTQKAVQCVAYPVAGFLAGKAVGFKLVK